MARKSRKRTVQEDSFTGKPVTFPAYVYARISNESSHAEDSIDNQIAICKEYINADNDLMLGGIFTDLGFTGTDFERPGYSDMMSGILSGNIKCIVVKDLSRIGRTYIEVGELLFDTFVQYGVRFVSVNDRYDSFADDAGRKKLLILFKNLVNHMYSRDLGKKIKSAHTAKKQRCEPAGSAPYGYRKNWIDKRLEIDTEAAEIVKMIFDMRQEGESVHSIARHLNQNNIPSPQQRRYQLGEITHENFSGRMTWSESLVSRILHNETYTGSLIQGKYECSGKKHKLLPKDKWIVHENAHDAIISSEQFNMVSRLVQKSSAIYQKKNLSVLPEKRYTGKIICSRCGKTAVRSVNRMKDPILFYYCCRHCADELKHENGSLKVPKLPLKKLDALVMATLRNYMDVLVQFDNMPKILSKSDPLCEKRAKIVRDKVKCEKTLGYIEKNLSTAYTRHLSGLLDLREYELIRVKVKEDKQKSETRLEQIKAEQQKYDVQNALDNTWLVKYRAFREWETPTKELIQTLINRIYLTPLTNNVHIELNFEDCFEELRKLMREGGVTVNVK